MSRWQICATCDGEGGHSRHLGCYSMDQFNEEFDDEAAERYFAGYYDRPCESCEGTGKVLTQEACAEAFSTDDSAARDAAWERNA